MKSIKNFVAVIALTTASFGALAAQDFGTVTATDNNLDSLEATLAAKATAAGATSYKIIEAGGQNNLHGTAVLYK
ncbi:DUF1471 domain-containing protein [Rahnella sp. SAP-1]|uniref:DUF1471 domain-containing protein n=1 Tax=Rouxiella aceris TaxID=2703884 RepID=A0A848MLX7_9GAMM|nr:YdgH/BhsA/McbA-like domain containing protein [Rouxiella aceris]NMP28313.1 DUF1471 domain-containing protein [Rouxiella aceris]